MQNLGSFTFPPLTEAARDLITSPKQGEVIFNTTSKVLNIWIDSSWEPIDSGLSGGVTIDDIALHKGNLVKNIITAATLTSNVNNWSPTGFNADTDMIRVDVNANNRAITGIVAPPAGLNRVLAIKNINTGSSDLRFAHNNAGSTAANRFLVRDNTNKSIKPNETALWFYDHIVSRWTPFNRIG